MLLWMVLRGVLSFSDEIVDLVVLEFSQAFPLSAVCLLQMLEVIGHVFGYDSSLLLRLPAV